MAIADTARLATVLTLKDGLSPGLAKTTKNVGKFDSGIGKAGKGVGTFGKGVAKAGAIVATFAGIGLAASAKAAIDWEDAFQGVVKTVDATDAEFKAIADSIRAMSREMPIAATELAAIAEAGGAMGIKAKDIAAFTKQVAILASTTNVSSEEAATALGQLQNVIGLTGDEFDNFASALVDLGNKGASTEADILEIARRAGGAAKLFGIGKEAILGWSSAVANLGVNAELGGTALQNIFLKLMPKVNKGSKTLTKVMGKSAKEIKRLFAEDAGEGLELFIKKLAALPKAARLDAIQDVFGKGSGITRVLLGLTNDVDNLTDSLETSQDAWFDSSKAQEEFAKRNATVKSAIARLKNGIIDAAVSIGEGFAPALGRAADKLSAFLSDTTNRNSLKALGEDIGEAIDKIDFGKLLRTAQGVSKALKPALDFVIKLGEAVSKLPPELIGAGGAIVITNKLSGGLVLKGVEGIVGGLGESLARTLATSIPVFGKAFVQPVFVTNMGAGVPGATGGTGKVAGAVGAVTAVAGGATALAGLAQVQREANKVIIGLLSKGNAKADAQLGQLFDMSAAMSNPIGAQLLDLPGNLQNVADWVSRTVTGAGQKTVTSVNAAKNAITSNERSEGAKHRAGLSAIRQQEIRNNNAFRAGERATLGVKSAVNSKLSSANVRLDAIRRKRTSFTTRVSVTAYTSVRTVNGSLTTSARYASGTNTQGR